MLLSQVKHLHHADSFTESRPANLFHYQCGRRDHVLCHECSVSCHWLILHLHYSQCHCLELPSPRRCFLYHCLAQTQRYLRKQLKACFDDGDRVESYCDTSEESSSNNIKPIFSSLKKVKTQISDNFEFLEQNKVTMRLSYNFGFLLIERTKQNIKEKRWLTFNFDRRRRDSRQRWRASPTHEIKYQIRNKKNEIQEEEMKSTPWEGNRRTHYAGEEEPSSGVVVGDSVVVVETKRGREKEGESSSGWRGLGLDWRFFLMFNVI